MRSGLLAAVALLFSVAAIAVTATGNKTAVGETSCSQLVKSYLAQVALDGGITIIRERVMACRQTGNEAVARVGLLIEETLFDPFSATISKERRRLVVVIRFAKSPWNVVSAKVAG